MPCLVRATHLQGESGIRTHSPSRPSYLMLSPSRGEGTLLCLPRGRRKGSPTPSLPCHLCPAAWCSLLICPVIGRGQSQDLESRAGLGSPSWCRSQDRTRPAAVSTQPQTWVPRFAVGIPWKSQPGGQGYLGTMAGAWVLAPPPGPSLTEQDTGVAVHMGTSAPARQWSSGDSSLRDTASSEAKKSHL